MRSRWAAARHTDGNHLHVPVLEILLQQAAADAGLLVVRARAMVGGDGQLLGLQLFGLRHLCFACLVLVVDLN